MHAELGADPGAGGALIWLFDARGRLTGVLVGPPTWPIDDEVVELLVEHALDDDTAAVVVVHRRPGPAVVDDVDRAGFAVVDTACARAGVPVLWHLVDDGRAVRVAELA